MKDHLGNTRATYAAATTGLAQVAEYQHYYPFGMQIEGLCYTSGIDLPNKYLYNGKELQTEYNLQWCDYGARFYDPVLGRWHTVDPLAEKYRRWSPYNYAMDNPLRIIDPDGMGPWDIVKGAALITGGAIQWVGGVAAVSSGVGAPLGVALIMGGSATIGFGTAVLVNNGKENIPTGMGQALGRGYDLSTKNGSHTGEKVGTGLDFVTGIPTGLVNAALATTSNVTTVISGISTGETIINLSTSTDPKKVEANNTKTGSDKNTKSTPVKEDTKTQPTQIPNPFAPQLKKEENPVQDWGPHK
jgi:RHS repeat-associated protein